MCVGLICFGRWVFFWRFLLYLMNISREDGSSVEPVQVFVRIRPDFFPSRDRQGESKCLFQLDDTTIRLTPPSADGSQGLRKSVPAVDDKIFTFDAIFSPESTQEPVYERVSQHVRATIQGYNTTIFALGCTGSGKTFTMTGNSQDPGIIPRAISEIFSIIEKTAALEKDAFFYVRLSFVELYNNNFRYNFPPTILILSEIFLNLPRKNWDQREMKTSAQHLPQLSTRILAQMFARIKLKFVRARALVYSLLVITFEFLSRQPKRHFV
jgi:hypothetical protein